MRRRELACPGCTGPMEHHAVRGLALKRCSDSQCRGIWIELSALEAFVGRPVAWELLEGHTSRRCAVCEALLTTTLLPRAIPVEVCRACRGLYFDEGELQRFSDAPRSPRARRSTFSCVKCGGEFPLTEGNGLASGLACRA